jgi:hypothetical protein
MKKTNLINLIRENILEIGEASAKSYSYTLKNSNKRETNYTFELDDNPEYEGEVKLELETATFNTSPYIVGGLRISFNVFKSEIADQGRKVTYSATNLGLKTLFRIMSTVGKILDETIDYYNAKFGFVKIRAIGFELANNKASSVTSKGSKTGQDQRKWLYNSFMRKKFKIIDVNFKPSTSGLGGDIVWYLLEDVN